MTRIEYDTYWLRELEEGDQKIVKSWITRNGFDINNTNKIIWDQGKWIGVTYRRDEKGERVIAGDHLELKHKEFNPVIHYIPAAVIDYALQEIFNQNKEKT